MAIVPMTPAVAGTVALSAENNKLITNILDLDTRTTAVEAAVGGGTGEIPRKGGEWVFPAAGSQGSIGQGTLINVWTANGTPNGVSHSAGTFTVTDAGLYVVTANIRFTFVNDATRVRYIMITGNGASTQGVGDTWAKSSAQGNCYSLSCSVIRRLAAGTGIKVWAYYDSGTTTVIRENSTDNVPGVSIYKVGN
jgi:hypothetical protein